MNRIENYLNSLDKKNIIMLYLSVLVITFIIYYNYNYGVLTQQIKANQEKIIRYQTKSKNVSVLQKQLNNMKNELKKLKKQNLSLSEDLKYLNMLIKTSNVLHVNEKAFLNVLKDVLQKATNNNIEASYAITKNTNDYVIYQIDITGSFLPEKYKNFYSFLTDLEKIKVVKEIKNLNFNKEKNDVNFDIQLILWGLL